ncbi:MAG TPA: hypothetical protein P5266_05205, partial [Candidatus Fermentibacter sp.]|nr:hypothetical protein [Candidatus Fermentibacter sp.]
MKPIVKFSLFLLAFLLLLGIKGVKAQDEFTRVVRREFSVNPDALLTVNNRFGKIHCTNWDKQEVSIEATVTVTAPNQAAADKRLDRITIDISGTASAVNAITRLDEVKGSGKIRFSIDYMISLPASMNLDLTDKFGDIFINEVHGRT